MIYKAFAAVTLIAAPIIVLTVQSFVPSAPQTAVPSPMAPTPAPVMMPTPAPVVTPATAMPSPPPPPAPDAGNLSFGQPMPEAGKPLLAPGAGLPAAPASNSAPIQNVQSSGEAPK